MKCKHCQKEIEDSATVCPYCKTPVIRITPKKVCGYCYTELKKGDKACKGCGRKIPEELLKLWAEEDLKNALRDGQQSSSKDCYTEKGKLSSKQEGQRGSKTGTEESLQHKQNPSEKRKGGKAKCSGSGILMPDVKHLSAPCGSNLSPSLFFHRIFALADYHSVCLLPFFYGLGVFFGRKHCQSLERGEGEGTGRRLQELILSLPSGDHLLPFEGK